MPQPQPNPETFEANRDRLRTKVRKALKKGRLDIPSIALVEAVVDLVVTERVSLRTLIAERIVGPLIGRYEGGDDDLLERLAYVCEYHVVGEDGDIGISFPEGK